MKNITLEIQKYLELNHNKNASYHNWWDTDKTVLREVEFNLKSIY